MSKEPWYMQKPPGTKELGQEDVYLVEPMEDVVGKEPPERQQGQYIKWVSEYATLVMKEIAAANQSGLPRAVAPEGHGGRNKPAYAWHWQLGKKGNFFEALWFGADDNLSEELAIHRGMGWRFPILVVFQTSVSASLHRDILERYGTPYVVLENYYETEEPSQPDPPAPGEPDILERILQIVQEIRARV